MRWTDETHRLAQCWDVLLSAAHGDIDVAGADEAGLELWELTREACLCDMLLAILAAGKATNDPDARADCSLGSEGASRAAGALQSALLRCCGAAGDQVGLTTRECAQRAFIGCTSDLASNRCDACGRTSILLTVCDTSKNSAQSSRELKPRTQLGGGQVKGQMSGSWVAVSLLAGRQRRRGQACRAHHGGGGQLRQHCRARASEHACGVRSDGGARLGTSRERSARLWHPACQGAAWLCSVSGARKLAPIAQGRSYRCSNTQDCRSRSPKAVPQLLDLRLRMAGAGAPHDATRCNHHVHDAAARGCRRLAASARSRLPRHAAFGWSS